MMVMPGIFLVHLTQSAVANPPKSLELSSLWTIALWQRVECIIAFESEISTGIHYYRCHNGCQLGGSISVSTKKWNDCTMQKVLNTCQGMERSHQTQPWKTQILYYYFTVPSTLVHLAIILLAELVSALHLSFGSFSWIGHQRNGFSNPPLDLFE